MLDNKVILITGGTGSFGIKFTEVVLKKYKPRKIIIFSRDEMKQYEMSQVLSRKQYKNLRYFIGDVRDADRLHRALNGVDIVVHAAALKIVPTAEYNPFEAVKTNIFGAENIINVAIDNGVEKVLALSTDKAASPLNLYGATKLCAEKMFIAANSYSPVKTSFSVVRYGNVFGSRGSVVPFFRECSKKGVIPITDERMTRFWITLEQGVEFVLSSLDSMKGGEIFIPKLPSMKVVDLAKVVAPKAKIKLIGIRPGEKIHECLLTEDESRDALEYKNLIILRPKNIFWEPPKYRRGKPFKEGFSYTSDKNKQWMTKKELRKLIKNI